MQPVVKRMLRTSVKENRKNRYGNIVGWNTPIRKCARSSLKRQIEIHKFVPPVEQEVSSTSYTCKHTEVLSVPESLHQNEKQDLCALQAKLESRELDESVNMAAELGFEEGNVEDTAQEIQDPDALQLMKEQLEEHNVSIKQNVDISVFDTPLGRLWVKELATLKMTFEYKGCTCRYLNGIIYVDSLKEKWQIRYSDLFQRIVLYHKNKKGYRLNVDREPVVGYHVQHIQLLHNFNTDEMHEFRKPQATEYNTFHNYKGEPAVKDYLEYIYRHREIAEKRSKRLKRKRKELRDVLKDRNVKHEVKQRKRKKLRKEISHEMARDVLRLLNMLKTETNGEE